MKYFLFVCCLLALSRVALADEAFPAFVTGQGATGSITGTELMPVIQGGVTTKDTLSGLKTYFQGGGGGGVPNVTVLSPIAGDNASQITAALAASNTVVLSPGYYEVCSQVEIPSNRSLQGTDGVRQGIGNLAPNYPFTYQPTVVGSNGCPSSGNGSFANGQGFFHLHDLINLSGFAIQGQRQVGGHNQINCINAENSMSITIFGMTLADCYWGVDRNSSSVSGDHGSISQDAVISFTAIPYPELYGIVCGTGSGGNGCADERYTDLECEVPGNSCIAINGGIQIQISNSRFEDGFRGILLNPSSYINVNDNLFNRITAATFNGETDGIFHLNFVGNKISCTEPNNTEPAITLFAEISYANITNNTFAYNCTAAFSFDTSAFLVRSAVNSNRYNLPITDTAQGMAYILHNTPSFPVSGMDTADPALQTLVGSGATITPLTAAGPTGDTVAARLTENGATSAHNAAVTFGSLTGGNTYSFHMYFGPGSSGTRNVGMTVGGSGNTATAVFNPSTCALVTSSVAGTGTLVGTPSAISVGGGWCRGGLSFTGVTVWANTVSLYSGSTASYAGDSTSNILAWSNDTIKGAVSPGVLAFQP